MAVIKEGYNNEPLGIHVSGYPDRKNAEIWVKQDGLDVPPEFQKYKETLSYASLEELILLRDEINDAIKKLAGV